MTKAAIQKEIKTVLNEMGIPTVAMTSNASYARDLGLDSLDIAEMIIKFECRLNLEIRGLDAEKLYTIGDTIEYVNNRINTTPISSKP